MTDVAKRVNLTQVQTENLIQEMVDKKEIKAEIEMHENSPIVCFGTDDSKRKMLHQMSTTSLHSVKIRLFYVWEPVSYRGGLGDSAFLFCKGAR